MARLVVKCPKCEYQESIISTSMNAEMPPCPRCEGEAFIRMANITPVGGQKTVISTAGSQTTEQVAPVALPLGMSVVMLLASLGFFWRATKP